MPATGNLAKRKFDVLVAQTAMGDYRKAFLKHLAFAAPSIHFLVGPEYFYPSLKSDYGAHSNITKADNVFVLGRRILWQRRTIFPLLRCDNAVLEMNPHILNTWIVAVLRRIMGRPVVMWGHAWSRSGSNASRDRVRGILRRLATTIVVYTDDQRSELLQTLPYKRIVTAPNSLFCRSDIHVVADSNPSDIIYVGRLVREKKPELLLAAFHAFLDDGEGQGDAPSILHIVGDGPMLAELRNLAHELRLDEKVIFHGQISDADILGTLYSKSLVSASPGYGGLSVTQSLGFGVPIAIARNEPHAPEVAAIREQINGQYFESDDLQSLARTLRRFFGDRNDWIGRRAGISEECLEKYTVEAMAAAFAEACEVPR